MKYSHKEAQKHKVLCALASHFDAITGLEFWVFHGTRLDLLDRVPLGNEAAISPFAGDLDVVFLTSRASSGEDRLKQRDAGLKDFLTGMIDAASDVVELLRAARYRDDIARLNRQIQRGRIAQVVRLSGRARAQNHDSAAVIS